MPKLKAVIFDLDGTLLDTLNDIANAMNAALERFGLPTHPPADYRHFVGDGVETLVRRTTANHQVEATTVSQLAQGFREAYAECWDKQTSLYPGIRILLNVLEEEGIPKAVLSNKPHEFTELCVERFLGEWSFAAVQGVVPGVPKKPDPTGALQIAQQFGIAPAMTAYVGDTNTDMETARAAQMYPIGVLWGFREARELEQSGAKYLAATPTDIAEHLQQPV